MIIFLRERSFSVSTLPQRAQRRREEIKHWQERKERGSKKRGGPASIERKANENYAGGQIFLLIRVRGPRHLMSNAEVPHDSEIGPLADGHVGDLRKMLILCCRELFRSEQENERLNARLQRAIAHVQVVDLKYARLLEILLEILTDVAFSSLRVRSIMQEHNQLHQASSKLTDL